MVSATVTPPFPADSSRMSITAPANHAFQPGLARPAPGSRPRAAVHRPMGYSSTPAITYRMPARKNGGRCPTPTRMAR